MFCAACHHCSQRKIRVYLPARPSKLVYEMPGLLDLCLELRNIVLQVSHYITDGLERARDSLTEAAALRERFVLGTNLSRRVAAAAASAVISNLITCYFILAIFCILTWKELT